MDRSREGAKRILQHVNGAAGDPRTATGSATPTPAGLGAKGGTGRFGEGDTRIVNVLRGLAIDEVEKARSGHPGLPLGAAPMAYVLFSRHIRFAPHEPDWPDRDRFILSAGHGSALVYALLHVFGYDLHLDELRQFRQWGSRTPGHPERGVTPGVEVTTGPLGQGISNAVGMALGAAHLASRYNRQGNEVVSHRTYVICSDGDLMEGISHEAASFAGHLRVPGLIVLYDDNRISIEGSTDIAFTDDTTKRFRSYGWQVLQVDDGNDLAAIDAAVSEAEARTGPVMIRVRTHIGYGSPKVDTPAVHGAALGPEATAATHRFLGIPDGETFWVPDDVKALSQRYRERGRELVRAWQERVERLGKEDPELQREFLRVIRGGSPGDLRPAIPPFPPQGEMATRSASGKVLQHLAKRLPDLLGGSADLAPSNDTNLVDLGDIATGQFSGRNIHFGVREHGMAAVMNGMAAHGGLRPFGGTFLIFSDYMRPSMRLAALMRLPVTYVLTHDSIGLGEDGPTHQPIEQLASLDLIPNFYVVRPADANETRLGWAFAAAAEDHPTALALSRQKLPVLAGVPEDAVELGAYVLRDAQREPQAVLIASGSEVSIALAAQDLLKAQGVETRVVSAPCLKNFAARPAAEREAVLPPGLPHVVVIAGEPGQFLPFLGPRRGFVALRDFGASAPGEVLYREFGLTPEAAAQAVQELLAKGDRHV